MAAIQILRDSSANGYDFVAVGSPSVISSPAGGAFGNAVAFDGVDNAATTDALSIAYCAFDAMVSAGSIELILARTRTGVTERVCGQWSSIGSESTWLLYFGTDNKLNFGFYDSSPGFNNVASSGTITDTAAHSIQVSWDGTTVRLFIDGTVAGSLAFSSTFRNGRGAFYFARDLGSTADAFAGSIDEVRLSSIARNTANYTPATTPFTTDANTDLLLHMDAFDSTSTTFARVQSTPVLAKGGTYGGVVADALAAPSVCWDGTQYVMTVSFWNISAAKWYSGFFTSTDLVTWSYVSGSLRSPSGGDYILGNAGLAWFGSKYWFAYNHYASPATVTGITVQWSTDLLSWNTTVTLGLNSWGADPSLAVNPVSGKLECWYLDDSRRVNYSDTSDGTTWTARGIILTPTSNHLNFGEPDVCYYDGYRYALFDGATVNGERRLQMVRYLIGGEGCQHRGEVLTPSANAWEAVNIFDGTFAGVVNVGSGLRFYVLYAGSDIAAATDGTNSSIGLAYLPLSNRRRRVLIGAG